MPAKKGNKGYGNRPRTHQGGSGYQGSTKYRDLMSRRPRTSSFRSVFPWVGKDYSLAEFNPDLTRGKVSRAEVDLVFHRLRSIKGYRADYNTDFSAGNIPLYALIFIGCLFIPIPGICIGVGVIWYLESSRTNKKIQALRVRSGRLSEVLKKVNFEWIDKQVKWSVGELGAWIQLDMNFIIGGGGVNNGPMMRRGPGQAIALGPQGYGAPAAPNPGIGLGPQGYGAPAPGPVPGPNPGLQPQGYGPQSPSPHVVKPYQPPQPAPQRPAQMVKNGQQGGGVGDHHKTDAGRVRGPGSFNYPAPPVGGQQEGFGFDSMNNAPNQGNFDSGRQNQNNYMQIPADSHRGGQGRL